MTPRDRAVDVLRENLSDSYARDMIAKMEAAGLRIVRELHVDTPDGTPASTGLVPVSLRVGEDSEGGIGIGTLDREETAGDLGVALARLLRLAADTFDGH